MGDGGVGRGGCIEVDTAVRQRAVWEECSVTFSKAYLYSGVAGSGNVGNLIAIEVRERSVTEDLRDLEGRCRDESSVSPSVADIDTVCSRADDVDLSVFIEIDEELRGDRRIGVRTGGEVLWIAEVGARLTQQNGVSVRRGREDIRDPVAIESVTSTGF